MDTTNNKDGVALIGKGKNLTCFMYKLLVDEFICHMYLSLASFSHLALTFKFPKHTSMKKKIIQIWVLTLKAQRKNYFFKE
jgi:hypothetical protein